MIEESQTLELSIGDIFKDKDQLLESVKLYNLRTHVSTKTIQSTPSQIHLICSIPDCPFKLTAGWRFKKDFMKINTFQEHTCLQTFHKGVKVFPASYGASKLNLTRNTLSPKQVMCSANTLGVQSFAQN